MCSNNIKNLVLAAANFEAAKTRYPGYQQHFGTINGSDGKIGSWFVALMPYLEEQALRDRWDDTSELENWKLSASGDAAQSERFYPAIPWLRCSADSAPPAKYAPSNYVSNTGFYLLPSDAALGLECYSGVSSDSERSTTSQRSANGIFNNQLPPEVIDPLTGKLIRVFGPASQSVASADLRDGLTQTILFSENTGGLSWCDTSIHNDMAQLQLGMVWLYAGARASAGRPKPMAVLDAMLLSAKRGLLRTNPFTAHPASEHSGVITVAMADGSVLSLGKAIDYHVYQALMTPHSQQSDIPNTDYVLRDDDFRQ